MIKIKKILTCVLLFASCGLVEEEQETFEGSYYIVEGWSDFEKKEFQLTAIRENQTVYSVAEKLLTKIGPSLFISTSIKVFAVFFRPTPSGPEKR